MGTFARGKQAYAISDRSGMRFAYTEMVREWNGSLVHYSEYEAKQPQLDPKPVGSDPQALRNPRVQGDDTPQLILLPNNPFTAIISSGVTYINVLSPDHQRTAGDVVRFRGPAQVTQPGSGGVDTPNLQQFANIPTFNNVSDLNNVNGFTIALGRIDASGSVTGATTNDPLTNPINYFYITSTSNATTSNVQGGQQNSSAGPVTLGAV
tara:strand:+ start:941 stop:1564 length:624 start_codon:yes stop_codon:yes gene_type:complete